MSIEFIILTARGSQAFLDVENTGECCPRQVATFKESLPQCRQLTVIDHSHQGTVLFDRPMTCADLLYQLPSIMRAIPKRVITSIRSIIQTP